MLDISRSSLLLHFLLPKLDLSSEYFFVSMNKPDQNNQGECRNDTGKNDKNHK